MTCKNCKFFEDFPNSNKYVGKCHYGFYFNGKKMRDVVMLEHIMQHDWCHSWIDKKTGLTHFEVMCRVPMSNRTEKDIEFLSQFIDWREERI
jgi:hypothetical protein